MKAVWVLSVTLAVALADVSHLGYHYKVPQTSYGIPSYQSGGGSGYKSFSSFGSGGYKGSDYQGSGYKNSGFGNGYSSGSGSGVSSAFASTSSLGSGSSNSYGLGSGSSSSLGSGSSSSYGLGGGLSSGYGNGYYQSSGTGSTDQIARPVYQYTGNSGLGEYQNQYSAQYQSSALEKYQNYYQFQQQPTQIFKHFYVHAAPEDPEPPKIRAPIVLPAPQKHYKIIFVKAPTASPAQQIVTVPQVQNEEKTIVYVLVNKPDQNQEIIVPKVEQKPPSKPEVYFIKYKNKEDSQAVINNIVKDYNKGQSVNLLNTGVSEGASSDYDSSNVASSSVSSGLNSGYAQSGSGFVNSGVGSSYESSGYKGGYESAGLGTAQQSTLGSSGFYETPVRSEASVDSFGSQAYAVSGAQPVQTLNVVDSGSSSSYASPVTVSSTASSVNYEDGNIISTSQGIPHETYGPPKFRVN